MQGSSQSQLALGHFAAALPEYLTAAMSAPHAVSGVPASSTEGSAFDGPAGGPSDTWTSSTSLPSFVHRPSASVQQQTGVGPQASSPLCDACTQSNTAKLLSSPFVNLPPEPVCPTLVHSIRAGI